jgi:hypothetical protein
MTDPAVCVPMASGTMPAATAAADPLDERHRRCIPLRPPAAIGFGAVFARLVIGIDNVLDADRHAGELAERRIAFVEGARLAVGELPIDMLPGADFRLTGLDAALRPRDLVRRRCGA